MMKKKKESRDKRRAELALAAARTAKNPREITHLELWQACREDDRDFAPYGKASREIPTWSPDCSCGCRLYAPLEGQRGADWGVCVNPKSHRYGLLTFEHQGCRQFEL